MRLVTEALGRLPTWCRRHPVTLTILVVVVVLSVVAFLPSHRAWGWRHLAGGRSETFAQHEWWRAATELFAAGSVAELLVVAPLIVVILSWAESAMGSLRALVAYVGGGVAATLAGLGFSAALDAVAPYIPLGAPAVDTLSPIAALLCTAVAASAFVPALWRRRIRLSAFAFALTLFLYAGAADDLFALLAVPIGWVIGLLLVRRRGGLRIARSSDHEKRVLLSVAVAVTAIGPVVATAIGSGAGLLSVYGYFAYDPVMQVDGLTCAAGSASAPCPDLPDTIDVLQPFAGVVAVLPVLVLLVAAYGILKGRRGALWVAVAVNGALVAGMAWFFAIVQPETVRAAAEARGTAERGYVWHTLAGTVVGGLVPLAIMVALVLARHSLRTPSTTRALAVFGGTVGAAAAMGLLVSFAGTLSFGEQFHPTPAVADVVPALPLRLLPPSLLPGDALSFVPSGAAAQAVWYLVPAMFWLVVLVAVARLVLDPGTVPGSVDRLRARRLLESGGGGSMSFMSTWPGTEYWFAGDLDAAVAYRVRGTVAVTLGGPFGLDRRDPRVIIGFARHCLDQGLTPVFYSVEDDEADWDALGWQRLQIAEEAVLDLPTWSSAGKKRQDIRTATHRAEREGIVARWTRWSELTLLEQEQIREISETWIADRSLPEMGFTLGGVDELTDSGVRLMLAVEQGGRIQAATSWLPVFDGSGGIAGYTLDLMRRRPDAMNGVMEFVLGTAADTLRDAGLQRLSLSGSPLAMTERAPTGAAAVLDGLGAMLEPAYGFRSLLRFKAKFQPRFVPLWAIYEDSTVLPAFGVALARCYVPDLTVAGAARMAISLRQG